MTPRVYANPFVRESAPAHVVEQTPWRYIGLSYTTGGTYKAFVRSVIYSDGSCLSEDKLIDFSASIWRPTQARSMTS